MFNIDEKRSVWSRLKVAKKPIFIYGMGDGAQKIMALLDKHRINISGVFASDEFVRGHYFNGYKVQKYSDVLAQFEDIIVLLAFGTSRKEVISNIYKLCIEQEMYVPDVSIADEENFDEEFLEKNYNLIKKVYNALDESAKKDYCNFINFKLSGKLFYLDMFEIKNPYENIIALSSDETYFDVGAYNGDTVKEFIETVPSYKKIYAAEPDTKNFRKLKENTAKYSNIEYFNLGIYSENETMGFNNLSGRNSKLSLQAQNKVLCDSIDNILDSREVSYIKVDAEGQETNIIQGSSKTILAHKPKLNIAAYHKPSDVFTIPLSVLNIREDYTLKMYHRPYIPAWDTFFYFD